MKERSLKKRFRYWLDRRMANGTSGMVKLLVTTVLGSVLIVSLLVLAFGLHKDGKSFLAIFWDNFRSAMSSSFPSSESGGILYIILYTFLGLIGMIFTGMLIGIFSGGIRGKLIALQKDNPQIVEHGHTVILGFRYGEYALLEQLIKASGRRRRTIVVAEKLERTDMEDAVRQNIKVPKNVRLTFIKADITNPNSLECCAIQNADNLIIHVPDRGLAVKALLAVSADLRGSESWPKTVVSFESERSMLPTNMLEENHIETLHTANVVARTIARAATQTGVFEAFMEIINFNGFEFYFHAIPKAEGLTFGQVYLSAYNGTVAGIYRGGRVILDPEPSTVLEKTDLFIVFEEEQWNIELNDPQNVEMPKKSVRPAPPEIPEIVIIGFSNELLTIINELPDNINKITLAGISADQRNASLPDSSEFSSEIEGDYRSLDSERVLYDVVKDAPHIIVLSDRKKSPEDADTDVIMRIMKLRDIKKKYGLGFTITAEIRCENNRKLLNYETGDDFIVATDMSSMILAQICEDPRRNALFAEFLDEEGSEIYLKTPEQLGIKTEGLTNLELRAQLYAMGYILLGFKTSEDPFIPYVKDGPVELEPGDGLVVIGEE
ncbi:MAG: hypothetical protein II725_04850 [Firmicutes bacterium]|nr:hypothetical protein [Bacillota bacterium]